MTPRREGDWIIAEEDGQRIYIVPPDRKRTGWKLKLMGYHWSELPNGDMAELNALPLQGFLLPGALLIYAFAEYGWIFGLLLAGGTIIGVLLLFAIYDKFHLKEVMQNERNNSSVGSERPGARDGEADLG